MGVLPVQVDELSADRRQFGGRRHAPIDVGAGPAARRHDPRQDPFLVVAEKPSFHPRLVRTPANEHTVRSAADQKVDRFDHKRLAGAGLTRQRRHARAEDNA